MSKKAILSAIALIAGFSWHLWGSEGPIRVFVTDSASWEIAGYSEGQSAWVGSVSAARSSSALSGGARPQTTEIIKAVNERCPEVIVTMVPARANFILRLDHVRKDNKVAVFDSAGDLIFSDSTRLLGNAVKDACGAILRWVDAHGIPASAGSLAAEHERETEWEGEGREAESRPQGDSDGVSRAVPEDDTSVRGTPPAIVRLDWGDEEPLPEEVKVEAGAEAEARPDAEAEPEAVAEQESSGISRKPAPRADDPPAPAPAAATTKPRESTARSASKEPAVEEKEELDAWLKGVIVLVLAGLALASVAGGLYSAFKRSWGDVAFFLGAAGVVAVVYWVVFYQPDFKAMLERVGSLVDSEGEHAAGEESREFPKEDAAIRTGPPAASRNQEAMPAANSRHLERSTDTGLLGAPLPKGARIVEDLPGNLAVGVDPRQKYVIKATQRQLEEFFRREMAKDGWSIADLESALMFKKGGLVLGVLISSQGGSFTLMGS